jgi:hypothetical protein
MLAINCRFLLLNHEDNYQWYEEKKRGRQREKNREIQKATFALANPIEYRKGFFFFTQLFPNSIIFNLKI